MSGINRPASISVVTGEQRSRWGRWWWWAGVFGLALAMRLIYLYQVEGLVFFYHLVGDAKGYDAWAQGIAGGQWWWPDTFYQAPLYPYSLACLYTLIGRDLWLVRVIQCVMGSAGCALVAIAAAWFFSRRVGLVAGILMAVYPPAIFFDGIVQKASLGFFLLALLLCVLGWERKRASCWPWLGVGMLLGLLGLTRENALALIPVMVGWLLLRRGACNVVEGTPIHEGDAGSVALRGRTRWMSLVMLVVGLGVTLLPVGIHNYSVGGEFALTTFQMGPNFYMGNHEGADGRILPMIPGRETPEFERADATALAEAALQQKLTPREVSDYWFGKSLSYIGSDPVGWVRLLWHKWWLTWNRYEIPDMESYYIHRDTSRLLGCLGTVFHFGVLCPLGVAGIALTWSRRARLVPLYLIMLTIAGAVALFYVFGRYRYPLVPILAIFAAAGLVEGATLAVSQRWRSLGGVAGLALAAALWVNWPINPESELNAAQLGNLGAVLAEEGRLVEALPHFEQAVAGHPEAPRLRQFLADALSLSGRYADAIPHYYAVLDREPGRANMEFNLAVALESVDRLQEALDHYRLAVQINPEDEGARRAVERLEGGR